MKQKSRKTKTKKKAQVSKKTLTKIMADKVEKVRRKGSDVSETQAVAGEVALVEEEKKTNWQELKIQFFQSNYIDVVSFLRAKEIIKPDLKKPSGFVQSKIKGWKKQKMEIYDEQTRIIRDDFRKQATEYVRDLLLPLQEAKRFALNAILERLGQKDAMGPFGPLLRIGDLIQILHIIKVELGEPNEIIKTKNLNANLDLNKLIEYVDKSDKPFNRKDFEAALDAERFGDLPTIVIDGREQRAN